MGGYLGFFLDDRKSFSARFANRHHSQQDYPAAPGHRAMEFKQLNGEAASFTLFCLI
jgi:hypothetical protein